MLLLSALLIFAIAALGGMILAANVLRRATGALGTLRSLHALLGATGLVLLVVVFLQGAASARVTAALGLLVLAALGGFYLASIHLRKKGRAQGGGFRPCGRRGDRLPHVAERSVGGVSHSRLAPLVRVSEALLPGGACHGGRPQRGNSAGRTGRRSRRRLECPCRSAVT